MYGIAQASENKIKTSKSVGNTLDYQSPMVAWQALNMHRQAWGLNLVQHGTDILYDRSVGTSDVSRKDSHDVTG